MVEVLVRGQTFPLELDKKSKSSPETTKSAVRPSGRNYRPEFGKESQKPTKPGEKRKPDDGKKPVSGPKPGGLKDVPLRNRNKNPQSNLELIKPFGSAFYEKPAFDPYLQRFAMDPAELSIQREIVRGQYSREIPTDLPVEGR